MSVLNVPKEDQISWSDLVRKQFYLGKELRKLKNELEDAEQYWRTLSSDVSSFPLEKMNEINADIYSCQNKIRDLKKKITFCECGLKTIRRYLDYGLVSEDAVSSIRKGKSCKGVTRSEMLEFLRNWRNWFTIPSHSLVQHMSVELLSDFLKEFTWRIVKSFINW